MCLSIKTCLLQSTYTLTKEVCLREDLSKLSPLREAVMTQNVALLKLHVAMA